MKSLEELNRSIQVDRKAKGFTQIYNTPIQNDLNDLAAIGLLTYIISLPDDWKLYKTKLHQQFSRRTVESAWTKLLEKNYALDISFYVQGKKGKVNFYRVSDKAYTQDDFTYFLRNAIETYNTEGFNVNLSTVETKNSFDLPKEIYDVQNVHHKKYSTKCTSTNKEITNKEITNKHSLTIVNKKETKQDVKITSTEDIKKEFISLCNKFYTEFAPGRWSKEQWNSLIQKYVSEIIQNERYFNIPINKREAYVYQSIKNMAEKHHDYKKSQEFKDYQAIMQEIFS